MTIRTVAHQADARRPVGAPVAERLHRAPGGALTVRVLGGDPTVLVVHGDLDANGLALFRQIVDPLLEDGVCLQVDLSGVEFASLTAASYLVADGRRAIALLSPSRAVERAVELARRFDRRDAPEAAHHDR